MTVASDCLIVGGGQAAGCVAIGLRDGKFSGSVDIVTEETFPPYERPPLSKSVLAGTQELASTLVRPEDYYAENAIGLHLGQRVAAVNPIEHSVITAAGKRFLYKHLVLATGARPRRVNLPGANLAGVHYLRSISDSQNLRASLARRERVAIIGGGFIGLEVAAVAAAYGCKVTVIEAQERLLKRTTPPAIAQAVHRLHESHGIRFELHASMRAIDGDCRVEGLTFDNGHSLPAEVVVIGIGIIPNVELAEEAGLHVADGIVVDALGRTSAPDVYAAGDVSNHFNPLLGKHLRLEAWQHAQNHALAIARVICGDLRPYAEVPWVWSDQYDVQLQYAGVWCDEGQEVLRGALAAIRLRSFFCKTRASLQLVATTPRRKWLPANGSSHPVMRLMPLT